jgi:uncharacterized protein
MCLGKAYIEKAEGNRELVMESVSLLEIKGDRLRLSTIFGEEKELSAAIREIDFENSRIILEAV